MKNKPLFLIGDIVQHKTGKRKGIIKKIIWLCTKHHSLQDDHLCMGGCDLEFTGQYLISTDFGVESKCLEIEIEKAEPETDITFKELKYRCPQCTCIVELERTENEITELWCGNCTEWNELIKEDEENND